MTKHYSNKTRQIPVKSKKTGETAQMEAPNTKPRTPPSEELDTNEGLDNSAFVGTEEAPQPVPSEPNKSEKKDLVTLEEIVKSFYAGKIKSLTASRIKKISKQIFEQEHRELLIKHVSESDPSLDKTRQLLIQLAGLDVYSSFKHAVSEFIREIVARHPVMASNNLQVWFPNAGSTDEGNLAVLFDTIGVSKKLKTDDGKQPNNKSESDRKTSSELQKARLNIFFLAGIWRYSKGQISLNELSRVFRSTIYRFESDKSELEFQVLDFLVNVQAKDVPGLSGLLQWQIEQSDYDKKVADSEKRKSEQLAGQLEECRNLVASAQIEIEGLKEEVEGLRKQLEAAHEKERVQSIHMRADQQQQKGRTQRILEEEIPILSDCLKALDRDPPKVMVAKEYMGSVLEKLSKELNELRGE